MSEETLDNSEQLAPNLVVEYFILTPETKLYVENFNQQNLGEKHVCISTIDGVYCIERPCSIRHPGYESICQMIENHQLEKFTHTFLFEEMW